MADTKVGRYENAVFSLFCGEQLDVGSHDFDAGVADLLEHRTYVFFDKVPGLPGGQANVLLGIQDFLPIDALERRFVFKTFDQVVGCFRIF